MKVYLTKRIGDMTEGRGTMVDDLCFLEKEHAINYIDEQPGVMGRRLKWSEEKYGDWVIKEIKVIPYDVIREKN